MERERHTSCETRDGVTPPTTTSSRQRRKHTRLRLVTAQYMNSSITPYRCISGQVMVSHPDHPRRAASTDSTPTITASSDHHQSPPPPPHRFPSLPHHPRQIITSQGSPHVRLSKGSKHYTLFSAVSCNYISPALPMKQT